MHLLDRTDAGPRILGHPALDPLRRDGSFVPSEEDLCWFAGFIDGEGSIALTVHGPLRFVMATFSFANTNLDNIYRARQLVHFLTGRDFAPQLRSNRGRPAFQVVVARHEDVMSIVAVLRHRLTGKRAQAELMIEYLERCSLALRAKRRGADTPDEKALRHAYAARMQSLNKRYGPDEWARAHPDMIVSRDAIRQQWFGRRGLGQRRRLKRSTRALLRAPRETDPLSRPPG